MAFIDLGKLKFNWQGVWNSGTAYETDDVVFHGNQTWVATADVAVGQAEPQANASWDLMNGGLNFRGVYSGATTYYLHDMVTYGSALYLLNGTDNQTGIDPGSNPGSDNWDILTPAPDANVLHAVGDMVYRNKDNGTARLVVVAEAGKGLNTVEAPLETYPSRSFTYEEVSGFGNTFNTAGSIPAVSYTITTAVQRGATTHENWIVTGEDRNGAFTNIQDGDIYVNIGDTIVFDNSGVTGHPMQIVVSDGGAAVSTGTYTGGGTATVTWVTTGVAAGTYYYQCQTAGHEGMIGQIIVQDTTNRQGTSTGHGTIDVCRGKEYTITIDNVTNTGVAYDLFVDTGTAGSSKQLTAAEGSSGQVTYNGSAVTVTFTPNATTPNTVYIRNSSGTAVNPAYVEITVNDLKYVPSWGKATAQRKASTAAGASSGFTSGVRGWGQPNLNVNTNNPVSEYRTEYGHGWVSCNVKGGYYEFGYIGAQGDVMVGGMNTHNSPYSYYKHALGVHTNADTDFLSTPHLEVPQVVRAAVNGDTNYTKWLSDVDGNDLGYPVIETDSDWDGDMFSHMNAKYVETYQAMAMHVLTENGILYGSGYDGYGLSHGNGAPGNYPYKMVPIRFLDTAGSDKVDASYPKIKSMACSAMGDNTYSATTTQHAALDVDGNVYMGGYGNYGAPWGTGNDYYYRQRAQSEFGGYPVEYITLSCDSYNRGYAINNQGTLYTWGYNGYGQGGYGSTTNVNAPVSSMTGSLSGKRVIHVNGTGGSSSFGQSMALCDDGTVHFVGYDQYGLIGTSAGNYTTTWNQKSNDSTTINAGGRKVQAIYPVNQDSCMAICDDGSLWATGYNGYGQCGDGSGTNRADWVEVKVRLKHDTDQTASSLHTTASNYIGGFGDTTYWSGKQRVGRAKAVFAHFVNSVPQSRLVILDEYGTMYAIGYWNGMWNASAPNNNSTSTLYYAEPHRGQPEPMTWWNFSNDDAQEGSMSAYCVGESGLVYTFSTSGAYNNSLGSNDYTALFAPLNG